MNLIGDPWIPVIFRDGQHRLVSLQEAFEQGDEVCDLVVTPPQRVALMRLLLCITHAALDGPADEDDWRECKVRIPPDSLRYLGERTQKFDLFGPTPFLQVPSLTPTHNATLDKLDLGLAAGNNSTLFDQDACPAGRDHDSAWIALHLLTFQCFSPGGTIGETVWAGQKTGRNSEHAPCLESSALLTIIRGDSLLETVWKNLVTRRLTGGSQWGTPVWDLDTSSGVSEVERQMASTVLGRLVPVSRAVLLEAGKRSLTLANGVAFPKYPQARDTMACIIKRGDGEQRYLGINLNKHPWRELSGILRFGQAGTQGGAYALGHLVSGCDAPVDIWVGGVVAGKSGRAVDAAEWNFHVPAGIIGAPALLAYGNEIAYADRGEAAIREAVKTYRHALNADYSGDLRSAATHYWSTLDAHRGMLLNLVNEGADLGPWQQQVWRSMQDAYAFACPHETPRQIQAYAAGQQRLRIRRKAEETEPKRAKRGRRKEVTNEQE
ncbi:MAG: type I-E CRISPR-associated protein Cse1/CasA [Candidatus Eisenbacteria sp.]|nr:type I-E CRISPR-associated protein Cse1/CasA [Candidatus Eisenbacteria bacterium]